MPRLAVELRDSYYGIFIVQSKIFNFNKNDRCSFCTAPNAIIGKVGKLAFEWVTLDRTLSKVTDTWRLVMTALRSRCGHYIYGRPME